jgi:hypothetical protein
MRAHLHRIGRRVHKPVVGKVMFGEPRSGETRILSQTALFKDHLKRARPRDRLPWAKICNQIKTHGTISQWNDSEELNFLLKFNLIEFLVKNQL